MEQAEISDPIGVLLPKPDDHCFGVCINLAHEANLPIFFSDVVLIDRDGVNEEQFPGRRRQAFAQEAVKIVVNPRHGGHHFVQEVVNIFVDVESLVIHLNLATAVSSLPLIPSVRECGVFPGGELLNRNLNGFALDTINRAWLEVKQPYAWA